MQAVFDLDGTLVHTRSANLAAYQELGVTPPPDFHTRPWQEWCTPEVHRAKGLIIGRYLKVASAATPLMGVFEQIGHTILTNASDEVVSALCDLYEPLRRANILHMKPDEKVAWLRKQPPGFYFDDSLETVHKVREQTRWVAAYVQF